MSDDVKFPKQVCDRVIAHTAQKSWQPRVDVCVLSCPSVAAVRKLMEGASIGQFDNRADVCITIVLLQNHDVTIDFLGFFQVAFSVHLVLVIS